MKTAGERLKAIRKHFRDNQIALSEKTGISRPNLSQYETGERPLSRNVAEKIKAAYPTVNLHWLLTGEGDMLIGEEQREKIDIKEIIAALIKEQVEISIQVATLKAHYIETESVRRGVSKETIQTELETQYKLLKQKDPRSYIHSQSLRAILALFSLTQAD